MPRSRRAGSHVTNICVSFVGTYRATLGFFAQKDAAMADLYPTPFPNWQRGDRHFNLISAETRRVIRFEPNRLVVRVEGHASLDPYDEVLGIARQLFDRFGIKDIFGGAFTLTRAREMPSRKAARLRFAEVFLSRISDRIMPSDGPTDYAITLTRDRTVNADLDDMKPALAPLRLRTTLTGGPVEYREIVERFVEFKKDSENELYRAETVAPDFAVIAAVKLDLERKNPNSWASASALWQFHDVARAEAERAWSTIEEAAEE